MKAKKQGKSRGELGAGEAMAESQSRGRQKVSHRGKCKKEEETDSRLEIRKERNIERGRGKNRSGCDVCSIH